MSFSSVSFFVFMAAVFLIYWGIPHKFRKALLIFANLVFYSSFGIEFIPILLGEALLAYIFALGFDRGNKSRGKLIFAIIMMILPLLIFKYLNFSIYTVEKALSFVSIPVSEHTLKIIAPIGISFYTFESLSYIIDVYKGKLHAEESFIKLFAFLSFFPNITSGPIERADKFIPQIEMEKTFDYGKAVYGFRLILLGALKKICGADVLKQYVDAVFGNIYAYQGPIFIIAIVMYTFEIYLDFSGYTDMARGFAYLLGFELSENFKAPYLSKNIKEFFGRWHISLSQWLRDYIYIPLGGSRCSSARKYINLMITFLVSGIWHGASFTFIVWGLLHGVYQCAADILQKICKKVPYNSDNNTYVQNKPKNSIKTHIISALQILFTFAIVSFAWMFFRANSLSDAKYIIKNMLLGDNFYGQMLQMGFLTATAYIGVVVIVILTLIYDIFSEKIDVISAFGTIKAPIRWLIYIIAGCAVIILRSHVGAGADFIYFSF